MNWIAAEVVDDQVFEVNAVSSHPSWEGTGYEGELLKYSDLSGGVLQKVRSLQGRLATFYLHTVYGRTGTHILLIWHEKELAGVLWVVPGRVIRKRYAFVAENASAIISCVTSPSHRGRGLYPLGIQQVASSGLANRYFIWAHDSNLASLRGIEKAGGRMIGRFRRTRWLRGVISKVEYRSVDV